MKKTSKIIEMRSAVRFPLNLPIEVTEAAGHHQATTKDISSGGVLFHVDADLKVGSTIEFSISMPAEVIGSPNDVQVNCVGRVVRCGKEGEQRLVAAVIDEYRFARP